MKMTPKRSDPFGRMRTALFTLVFCLLSLIASPAAAHAAKLSAAQINSLFRQANDLFHQADNLATKNPEKAMSLYQQAAMRYERIVKKGGIENGKLYYDIGNAWFRTKDIGRAILNYRRAMQYIPDDPNLRQNLAYARQQRRDKIPEPPDRKVFKTLFFWHYDFSTPFQIGMFSLFFTAIFLFAGIRRFVRKPFFGWGLVAAIVLAAMTGGSLVATAVTLRTQKPGVIIDASVTARKGNSDAYAQSFTEPLHAGTEFILQKKRDGWDDIRLADGRTCWVPADSAEMVR